MTTPPSSPDRDYNTVPKSREERVARWGEGPWIDEPDRLEWRAVHQLPCLIRRIPMGSLCGYVAVPRTHPLHGASYDAAESHVAAHGGVTYASACAGEICHVPKPGERDDVWWFGFDCAHAFDVIPQSMRFREDYLRASPYVPPPLASDDDLFVERYRDVAYVRAEVERLAAQLSTTLGWAEYHARLEAARTPRQRRKAAVFAGLVRRRSQLRVPKFRELTKSKRFRNSEARRYQLEAWRSKSSGSPFKPLTDFLERQELIEQHKRAAEASLENASFRIATRAHDDD